MKTRILRCILAIAFAATAASAQQMNYQGRLTDNAGAPRPGPQATLNFSMWTLPTGGDKVWGDFLINAELIDGRFSVKLGTATGADGTPGGGRLLSNAFATNPGPRYLEIKVGTDAPLPRQQVLPAPTALHAVIAVIAGTVPDGAIGTNQLANLAVTGDKIADNTIPVAKLTGAGANFWDGNGTNVWRTGGRVGIGTSAPTVELDVAGQVRSFNGAFTQDAISGWEDSYIIKRAGGQVAAISMDPSGSRLHLSAGTGLSKQFTLTTAGNVGIGTTTPSAKLDVAGDIGLSGKIHYNRDRVINLGDKSTLEGGWVQTQLDLSRWADNVHGCVIRLYLQAETDKSTRIREWHVLFEQDGIIDNPEWGTFRRLSFKALGGQEVNTTVGNPDRNGSFRDLSNDGWVVLSTYIQNDRTGEAGGNLMYTSPLPILLIAIHPHIVGRLTISDR